MRDVAQKAGVSIKTVSRVVNNQGEISEATRQQVLAVIDELGYRPSRLARALVTRQTHTVGLLVSDITNPFFPKVARGIMDVAHEKGYNAFLGNTDGNSAQELSLLESLADHGVDGIILYPTYNSDKNLNVFVKHYRPVVIINHHFDHSNVSEVIVDNRQGAKLAVDHLVGKGHSAIAMLTGVRDPSLDNVRRIQGFRDALEANNLPVNEAWLIPSEVPTYDCGYDGTKRVLTERPQVTAIFAYNDLLALGALQACQELGRRVPHDMAIIGFDDIVWATQSTPSLTTIRTDKYELGRQATNRLFDMLEHPDITYPPISIGVDLVEREST
jgi:LacI family transcriptional regulator